MEFSRVLQAPWLTRIVKIGLFILVLSAAAWAVLPWLFRVGLEKAASEQIGRRLSVATIDIRPWSLELTLHGLELADASGQSAQLRLERLSLDMAWQSLLRWVPVVDALHIEGLRLRLTHLGQGHYDIDDILLRRDAAAPGSASASGGMPRFVLRDLTLQDVSVDLVDQAVGKTHAVRDLTLSIPFLSNTDAWRDTVTESRLAFVVNGAQVDVKAHGTPFAPTHKTEARLRLAHLDVQPYLDYWPRALGWRPQAGTVAADVRLHFEQQAQPRLTLSGTVAVDTVRVAGPGGDLFTVRAARLSAAEVQPLAQVARVSSIELDGVRLTQGAQTPLTLERIALADLYLDGLQRHLTLGRMAFSAPQLTVARDARGDWSFARWLPGPGAAAASHAATASAPQALVMTAAATSKGPPAGASSADAAVPASSWRWSLDALALTGGHVRYADLALPQPVSLALDEVALQAGPWSNVSGAPVPFRLSAQVDRRRSGPAQLAVNGTLATAPLAIRGQMEATRLPLHGVSPYFGGVLNVALRRADASVRGQFSYGSQPGGATMQFTGDAALEDVAVNALDSTADGDGSGDPALLSWKSLNLHGLDVALAPGQASRIAVDAIALSDFYARVIISPQGRINLQDVLKTSAATSTAGPPPLIQFGPVSLRGGRVQFTDRFIQPNYSARLTALTGRLGGFSSGTPQNMAELVLRGRAEGVAALDIRGRLNPLAQPLALDIQGHVQDLELPPLSPYAIKYAGHGIERGKLAMDVSYQVRPDGQLQASNRLLLQQLTFGDPVAGAPASLPVRLAVALLADRNGVIDVDLPIRGSLNDPEFSLGPVIFKAVMNLFTKVVSAPFSLLASLFDGEAAQGVVHFPPGSAALAPERRLALDKMVDAMQQRPALTLTLVGSASLAAEGEAFRRQRLDEMLQAGKPRAAASVPVGDEQMRQLAQARSAAVRDYLLGRGLPAERLFMGPPKLVDETVSDWTPQVDMVLAAH